MLAISDLVKTYSSGVQALKGISLELQPGVFGLLGPNGAGKTTLMTIVATLLEPDSGTIEMNAQAYVGQQMMKRYIGCSWRPPDKPTTVWASGSNDAASSAAINIFLGVVGAMSE